MKLSCLARLCLRGALGHRTTRMGSVSASMLGSLPPHSHLESLWPTLAEHSEMVGRRVVVLDDDPTGCQTVYDTDILLDYSVQSLKRQLRLDRKLFYILTNTRAMAESDAFKVNQQVIRNLFAAAEELSYANSFQIISRGDSTLRGHYPAEVDAIAEAIPYPVDGTVVFPAFFEGGRVTVNDTHFVQEGDLLTPVGETQFARDSHFGFRSSDLKEWVVEKIGREVPVTSISIQDIREGGASHILNILEEMNHDPDQVLIVNGS